MSDDHGGQWEPGASVAAVDQHHADALKALRKVVKADGQWFVVVQTGAEMAEVYLVAHKHGPECQCGEEFLRSISAVLETALESFGEDEGEETGDGDDGS